MERIPKALCVSIYLIELVEFCICFDIIGILHGRYL